MDRTSFAVRRAGGEAVKARGPTAAEVLAARKPTGLTQEKAAQLVHAGLRSWNRWESVDGSMPQAKFDLFLIKTSTDRIE